MSKIRRVDFSPDEFLAGTTDLTLEETGAYWKACSLIYSRGGPVLDDEAWLARALGCHVRTWRKVRERLFELGKLRLVDLDGRQHITNGRAERELGHATKRIDQAREAAEESARKRREKAEGQARDGRGEGEGQARDGRGEGENSDVSANINELDQAGATPRSSSQPSTINHQPPEEERSPSENGASAPPASEPVVVDPAAVIFRQGLRWLMQATGKPERDCRSLLGKWRRDAKTDANLIEILGAAQRHGPIDAIEWVTAAIKERVNGQGPRNEGRPKPSSLRTTANLAAVLSRASDSGTSDD